MQLDGHRIVLSLSHTHSLSLTPFYKDLCDEESATKLFKCHTRAKNIKCVLYHSALATVHAMLLFLLLLSFFLLMCVAYVVLLSLRSIVCTKS